MGEKARIMIGWFQEVSLLHNTPIHIYRDWRNRTGWGGGWGRAIPLHPTASQLLK